MTTTKPTTIDEYIAGFPAAVQQRLEQIRATIHQAAPGAEESISYGMPGFKLKGKLVWFAAYKNHIGLYPTYGLEELQAELAIYKAKGTKDSLHFPFDKPLPLELISKIVAFRVAQNLGKTA